MQHCRGKRILGRRAIPAALLSTDAAVTTRNCITRPVESGSEGSKSMSGRPSPNGSSGPRFLRMIRVPTGRPVEVDDHIRALRRRDQELFASHRRVQEAAFCPNLPERQPWLIELRTRKRELQPLRKRNR